MSSRVETVEILGVPLARLEPDAALAEIERLYDEHRPALVAHANAHTLNLAASDRDYRELLCRADLVLNDGKGVMLAGLLRRQRFPADLNGNFFSPLVLGRAAARRWPVFLLGARPGVVDRAARRLVDDIPDLRIVGARHGYFAPGEAQEVATEIQRSGAGLLMVGLGNPLQEKWLDAHLHRTEARVGVGVGAFFAFQAGEVARAPAWMNRMGLEWVHRLAQEPGRMWRRYLVGNPLFLARVVREIALGRRDLGHDSSAR